MPAPCPFVVDPPPVDLADLPPWQLQDNVRTLVSDVCPVFDAHGVMTGVRVEYTVFLLPSWAVLQIYCVTNPAGCCGTGSGSGSGPGPCCDGVTLPNSVCLTILNSSCPGLNGTYLLTRGTWAPDVWQSALLTYDDGSAYWQWLCEGDSSWRLSYFGGPFGEVQFGDVPANVVCSPLSASGSVTDASIEQGTTACGADTTISFDWVISTGACGCENNCPSPWPDTVCLSMRDAGNCPPSPWLVTLHWDAPSGRYSGSSAMPSAPSIPPPQWYLQWNEGQCNWLLGSNYAGNQFFAASFTCRPFSAHWRDVNVSGQANCEGGLCPADVSEGPCAGSGPGSGSGSGVNCMPLRYDNFTGCCAGQNWPTSMMLTTSGPCSALNGNWPLSLQNIPSLDALYCRLASPPFVFEGVQVRWLFYGDPTGMTLRLWKTDGSGDYGNSTIAAFCAPPSASSVLALVGSTSCPGWYVTWSVS